MLRHRCHAASDLQARAPNVKRCGSKLRPACQSGLGGFDMWNPNTLGFFTAWHAGSWASPMRGNRTGRQDTRRSTIQARRQAGPLTSGPNVSFSMTNHEESQPAILQTARSRSIPMPMNLPKYAEPAQRLCPAGDLRGCRPKKARTRALLINFQKLRCIAKPAISKTPAREYHWATTAAAGTDRNYPNNFVDAALLALPVG